MNSQITVTKMVEGSRSAIFHVYLESTGMAGELKNEVILDPLVDFSPPADKTGQFSITQIWSSLVWFDVMLSFDALVPTQSWILARDKDTHVDFRYFGGIKDRSDAEHSGKIFITTNGFEDRGSKGTIIIEVKKSG